MAIYKIKAEDKAALLNRLERLNVNINSNDLKNKSAFQNGTVVNYFELSVNDPEQEEKINSILNQSPAINKISEMEHTKKKMTKDELKEMVRQELQAVLAEKKKVKGEYSKEKLQEFNGIPVEMIPDFLTNFNGSAEAVGLAKTLVGLAAAGMATTGIKALMSKAKAKFPSAFEKVGETTTPDMSGDEMNESLLADAAPILATLLGVGGSIAAALVSDLRKAKTPEEKKRVLQNVSSQISKSKGF
jgi:hypothetical protein